MDSYEDLDGSQVPILSGAKGDVSWLGSAQAFSRRRLEVLLDPPVQLLEVVGGVSLRSTPAVHHILIAVAGL